MLPPKGLAAASCLGPDQLSSPLFAAVVPRRDPIEQLAAAVCCVAAVVNAELPPGDVPATPIGTAERRGRR